ncbi:MAG TPA: hypothetical protein VK957_14780 [Lunatimonas sp.]|nr:hypothetical protein [Lunatimonas sp.]
MKNGVFNLLLALAIFHAACNNDDVTPTINPIIGEWVAAEGQFLILTVDGEEKSLVEFGMEVLRTNEAGAELAARDYLQYSFLGPIDMQEPKLLFESPSQLSSTLSGEQIEGTWRTHNERTVLKITAPDLSENDFSFNLKKLTVNELELDWSWEMSYIGETTEPFHVGLKIKLIK